MYKDKEEKEEKMEEMELEGVRKAEA